MFKFCTWLSSLSSLNSSIIIVRAIVTHFPAIFNYPLSGLVGSVLPKFSIFGDTMNTASRMESTCTPGEGRSEVQMTVQTRPHLYHVWDVNTLTPFQALKATYWISVVSICVSTSSSPATLLLIAPRLVGCIQIVTHNSTPHLRPHPGVIRHV